MRFIYDMLTLFFVHPEQMHWPLAIVISTVNCAVIASLQLYWFVLEVVPALKAALVGKEIPAQRDARKANSGKKKTKKDR